MAWKGVGLGWHIPVPHPLAVLTQAPHVQGAGRQGDAAGKGGWLGGESQEVSSSAAVRSSLPADPGGLWRRGPQ
jgi:hypothetical protein